MCTLTWTRTAEGYELLFNRDELATRSRGLPPRETEVAGVRVLAPVDADAGGTWLGVNERGLCVGLLNSWGGEPGPAEPVSRGLLVRSLLDAGTVAEVGARLADEALVRYRGFRLFALAPEEELAAHAWDGRALRTSAPAAPLVSGQDPALTLSIRRAELERAVGTAGVLDGELLRGFHASHAPERGPHSPCMHRAEASTVSANHLRVGGERAELYHTDGPPCSAPWEGPWSLDRR